MTGIKSWKKDEQWIITCKPKHVYFSSSSQRGVYYPWDCWGRNRRVWPDSNRDRNRCDATSSNRCTIRNRTTWCDLGRPARDCPAWCLDGWNPVCESNRLPAPFQPCKTECTLQREYPSSSTTSSYHLQSFINQSNTNSHIQYPRKVHEHFFLLPTEMLYIIATEN